MTNYYTVAEAAEQLTRSKSWVRNQIKNGAISVAEERSPAGATLIHADAILEILVARDALDAETTESRQCRGPCGRTYPLNANYFRYSKFSGHIYHCYSCKGAPKTEPETETEPEPEPEPANPLEPEPDLYSVGCNYQNSGDDHNALHCYSEIPAENGWYAPAQYRMATIYNKKQDFSLAWKHCTATLLAKPSHEHALVLAAKLPVLPAAATLERIPSSNGIILRPRFKSIPPHDNSPIVVCHRCNTPRPLLDYFHDRNADTLHQSVCKRCYKPHLYREVTAALAAATAPVIISNEPKTAAEPEPETVTIAAEQEIETEIEVGIDDFLILVDLCERCGVDQILRHLPQAELTAAASALRAANGDSAMGKQLRRERLRKALELEKSGDT